MKNQVINCAAFIVLALLWLGFGAALVFDRGLLDTVWQLFRGWPLVGQLLATLLILPVVLAMWIWQTTWPLWLRLILVIGLALATLVMFFPKRTRGEAEPALIKS